MLDEAHWLANANQWRPDYENGEGVSDGGKRNNTETPGIALLFAVCPGGLHRDGDCSDAGGGKVFR